MYEITSAGYDLFPETDSTAIKGKKKRKKGDFCRLMWKNREEHIILENSRKRDDPGQSRENSEGEARKGIV